MTQVPGSIYRHFLLLISVLSKQNITWNTGCWFTGLTERKVSIPFNAIPEMYNNVAREIRSAKRLHIRIEQ